MEPSTLAAALLATLFSLAFTPPIQAQNLTGVKCTATLPSPRGYSTVLYDNEDSIYLFGGAEVGHLADILKYSISQDTIQVAGQLPSPSWGGSAVINKFRNIFYLSGYGGKGIIYQYLPDLRSLVQVSAFSEENYAFAAVSPDNDTALLFGGWGAPKGITSLDLNNLESERSQNPLPANGATNPTAIWVEETSVAYIFHGETIQKYFRANDTAVLLPQTLPVTHTGAASVWDGKFGYLIGEIYDQDSAPSLLQFDPETETTAFIPVQDFISVSWASSVYIEKLNRIYTLGGLARNGTGFRDDIWYIDLDPLSQPPPPPTTTEETPITTMDPDLFDCVGRPDSNYPYPGDCARFVVCMEGHGYAFECPEPLHFDPVNRHCTFPQKARCE